MPRRVLNHPKRQPLVGRGTEGKVTASPPLPRATRGELKARGMSSRCDHEGPKREPTRQPGPIARAVCKLGSLVLGRPSCTAAPRRRSAVARPHKVSHRSGRQRRWSQAALSLIARVSCRPAAQRRPTAGFRRPPRFSFSLASGRGPAQSPARRTATTRRRRGAKRRGRQHR